MLPATSYKLQTKGGFTLVELLVAVGIFTTVMGLSTAVFVSGLRNQQAIAELATVLNHTTLALEQVMREVRTGNSFNTFDSQSEDLPNCDNPPGRRGIQFTNADGEGVRYFECQALGVDPPDRGLGVRRRGVSDLEYGPTIRITSREVFTEFASFELQYADPDDNRSPLITMFLCATTKRLAELRDSPVCMQSSVSARETES